MSNTNDAGPGSLRQAILDANTACGADTIVFGIPGPGVHAIGPLSPLPALTDDAGTRIDGCTQPGSSANTLAVGDNAVLLIELNGAALGVQQFGFTLRSSSNLVRGLVINGFGSLGSGGGGISVEHGSGNVVSGCFLGTDATGSLAKPNEFGVEVAENEVLPFPLPSRTTIGGTLPSERNVISGNLSAGILIGVGASDTLVAGNYVGTDSSGGFALGNSGGGIVTTISAGTLIGGTAAGSGNVISGNVGYGLFVVAAFFGDFMLVGGDVAGAGD